ncbi:Slp family lipoprotein [Lacimicrobium sp. SS2-24]|uniref:Slp family lipoprotein n=1 Tax=Lacimicrobium sp. SS2-24 TaxID=2005569 RepID=UPI000B4BAEF2|nr:Slp family lipoprotein [Lacimicrobium sp. SS2-24]
MQRLIFALMVLGLAGCSTVPESIKLENDSNLANYQQVSANPQKAAGTKIRWGGVIARVDNLKQHTRLEMLYYPLRHYGRPITSEESAGRFRVYIDGFLDPMVYKTGRLITVVGEAGGSESGTVGEHQYVFPVVNASGYHMWDERDRVSVTTFGVGMGFWPHYYSSWYGWHLWPYHQRTIIRSRHSTRHGSDYSGPSNSPVQRSQPSSKPVSRPATMPSNPPRNTNRDMGNIQRR